MQLNYQQLNQQLQQWNQRRRLRDALLWLPRGLLTGLLAAVILATVARLRPLIDNQELGYAVLALALTGLLVSLLLLFRRAPTLKQQARFADRQFQLRERVSTAVELWQGDIQTSPALARQQMADTLLAAGQVDADQRLPLRFDRRDWWLILLAAGLLAAAVLIPNPQNEALKKRRAVAESIGKQADALESLRQEILANEALNQEQQEALTAPIEEALSALNEGEQSQEGAVAALSEAEADLRQLVDENNQDALRQQLQTAAQSLAENENGGRLGQQLQDGNLSQAGAAATQLADQLPQLSAAEQAELAEDLAATAAQLQSMDGQLAEQLAAAAEALRSGETAAAQQALQEAAATLQQRAQEAAAAQQAQGAADQLNQGRQEVAQADQPDAGQPTAGQGQGQGEGQGDGQGAGQGPGQGQGEGQGSGDGQGEGTGTGAQTNQGEGAGGPGPGGGHAENVFVPDLTDLSGVEGVDVELPAECLANPAECGGLLSETPTEFGDEGSIVPYNQVFGDYRDAAYEALADEYVPLGLRGTIRDYFSSLEP